jgi:hypothetical protein
MMNLLITCRDAMIKKKYLIIFSGCIIGFLIVITVSVIFYPKLINNKNFIINSLSGDYYLYNPQENSWKKLFQKSDEQWRAIWTPNASLFAFIKKENKDKDGLIIYSSVLDGQPSVIWDSGNELPFSIEWLYTWSPDGNYILFTAQPVNQTTLKLYVLDVKEKSYAEIQLPDFLSPDYALTLSWSSKNRIAAGRYGKIYIINPNGNSAQYIADGYLPTWNPEGTEIVYVCPLEYDDENIISGFCIVNPDSKKITRLWHFPHKFEIGGSDMTVSSNSRFVSFIEVMYMMRVCQSMYQFMIPG